MSEFERLIQTDDVTMEDIKKAVNVESKNQFDLMMRMVYIAGQNEGLKATKDIIDNLIQP